MPSSSKANASPAPPALGTFIDDGALELVEVLGYGGYGVVYRAIDVDSASHPSYATSYAIKCLIHAQTPSQSARQRQVHLREIELHKRASGHRNVVTLHRVIEEGDYTYIVMDFCSDGDLFNQILNNRRYLGREKLIKHVFLQLLDAVEYCHALGIYHRDLKPENVLCFDGGLRLAITDFGLATTDEYSEEFRTGSVYHMSPECRGGCFAPTGTYSPLSNDIWSLGIILLNIITGRNPWRSASESDPTFRAYMQNPHHFLPTVLPISPEVNVLLTRVLEVDWPKRLSLADFKRAVKNIKSFYSSDVIFQGSMARCPWEADIDLEDESSPDEDVPADLPEQEEVDELEVDPEDENEAQIGMDSDEVETERKLASCWSSDSDSEMVFATQSEAEASWTAQSSEVWHVNESEFMRSASPSPASSRPYARMFQDEPVTPPSTHSMDSPVQSIPSLPLTPRGTESLLEDVDGISNKPALTIDTGCVRTIYSYHFNEDAVSPGSSAMQTAIESAQPWSASSFFYDSVQVPKPSEELSSAVDVGMDFSTDDEGYGDPMDNWAYSTTETESVAYVSSSSSTAARTSITGLDLNFDTDPSSPDEMACQSPVRQSIFIPYPPPSQPTTSLSYAFTTEGLPSHLHEHAAPLPPPPRQEKHKSAGLFSPIKSAFLRPFSPNTSNTFPRLHGPVTNYFTSGSSTFTFSRPATPAPAAQPFSPSRHALEMSPISPNRYVEVHPQTTDRTAGLRKRRRWFSLSPARFFTNCAQA